MRFAGAFSRVVCLVALWSVGGALIHAQSPMISEEGARTFASSYAKEYRAKEYRATAEGPMLRVIERTPEAVTVEVTAHWPTSLSEALQRGLSPADGPSAADLLRAAVGGRGTVSHMIDLGTEVSPSVVVLSADYEEAPLLFRGRGLNGEEAEGFEVLRSPVAEVGSVGIFRKRLVGTLGVRLLRVDGQTVRRLRRVVVRVRRASPGNVLRAGAAGAGSTNPHLAVERSVLADGTWYKMPIHEEGVYRIDRAVLQSFGINPDATDPARVQVYGNGGDMLPALNSAPRIADLAENTTLAVGGGDGSFDEGDAVYFFAEGPYGWTWDTAQGRWTHFINLFSTTSTYFLRIDAESPARVGTPSYPAWGDAEAVNLVEGRMFDETDMLNLERDGGGSGLDWMGPELLTSSPRTVLDSIPPGYTGGAVSYRVRVAARAQPRTAIMIETAGGARETLEPRPVTGNSATSYLARDVEATISDGGSSRIGLTLERRNVGNGTAWLDFAEAVFPQAPRASGGVLRFATPGGEPGRFTFSLEGFSETPQVWDVTHPDSIRRLGVSMQGGQPRVQVEVLDGEEPREIVAFVTGGSAIRTPAAATPVANQNLHAVQGFPDYVIVTPAAFREEARRLAEYRQGRDGLQPVVVNVEAILNEFSGGTNDMRAVRDYAKFLYDRAPADQLPRYLLLFGDGHYDYRGIENGIESFVPVYQTEETFEQVQSYTSDDYYALLDDTEGVWESTDERMDLGVGRIPARSAAEARAVVDKIMHYESPETQGEWRTRYTFLADDQFPNREDIDLHLQNADEVAQRVANIAPALTQTKIYEVSYPLVTSAAGRRRPAANEAIRRNLESGTLLWNYSGHGGPVALSDERIFTREMLEGLTNRDRLPVFITATCSFGKYDAVSSQSLAEETLLKPDGGAIALMTTVRVVYTSSSTIGGLNLPLNLTLADSMLVPDENGLPRRLGDAMLMTKMTNTGASMNSRKFNLLGDPAMRLGMPARRAAVTRINGIAVEDSTSTPRFRAFEEATVEGQLLGLDGEPDPTFSGIMDVTVFDAEREVDIPEEITNHTDGTYTVRTDRLYSGRASVTNGTFRIRFLVPQDVSYSGRSAQIALYGRMAEPGRFTEALGESRRAIVAAEAGTPPDDGEGPRVRLFLDDTTFVPGGIMHPDPVLIAQLSDESGINTVGVGVGHELLLEIDGNTEEAINLSPYYEGNVNTYQSGEVRYPLRDLDPGDHTLRLTAWDAANNPTTEEIHFTVVGDEELVIENAYPYPNPTSGRSRFIFEHNQPPGTPATIQLRIYTLSGRPVRTLDAEETLAGGTLTTNPAVIEWDGLDENLTPLATGIYLYKLRVEVERMEGETVTAERIDRLAVIR